MARFLREDDTICALATAPGIGAIAVIRVSGPGAVAVVSKLCRGIPTNPESHRAYYTKIKNTKGDDIDEVVVLYFAKGRSFTSQETIELNCHGSSAIVSCIIDALTKSGARLAQPGEFTYRAFSSGRIDLVQAESVLSMIQSHSETGARTALKALAGGISQKIAQIENDLIWVLSRLEANIDFSSEDILFASEQEILEKLLTAKNEVEKLIASYSAGRFVKEGLRVAIIGPANAGKSSLLNRLVNDERAIVSHIPGTTRDRIDSTVMINGVPVTFVDTAGVRETVDTIEKIGIERSIQAAEESDLIINLFSPDTRGIDIDFFGERVAKKTILRVLNKSDLDKATSVPHDLSVSAKSGAGISALVSAITETQRLSYETDSVMVTQSRHFELLREANNFMENGERLILKRESPEICISEIQEALNSVMEIVGKKFDDEVLDRVFRDFCLGK